MRFQRLTFGSITIDGVTYEHDGVIDRGEIRRRSKKASKQFREAFGHTPLSVQAQMPWTRRRRGAGPGALRALPVIEEVKREAERRKVELLSLPTSKAIEVLKKK